MKILYAIQGTGNGHLSRAEDVIPLLQQYGDLDLFVSGAQAEVKLPFYVKYKSKGLSFYFGKNGDIDFFKTFQRNSSKRVYGEIKKFPVENYDFVINDFEPISAWACKKKGVPCIGLSHQSSLLSSKVPKPKRMDPVGEWILKNYAPVEDHVGFHFSQYDSNIYTPVIRTSVREMRSVIMDHYTVYLPSYDDRRLINVLGKIPVRWQIFSKHAKKQYQIGKLSVYPINKEQFVMSMASADGILCGAGFETPAEALYLNKKLMVIPMKGQHEQHYNAAALKEMGVSVIKKLKKKYLDKIMHWVDSDERITVHYENVTGQAVEHAMQLAKKKMLSH